MIRKLFASYPSSSKPGNRDSTLISKLLAFLTALTLATLSGKSAAEHSQNDCVSEKMSLAGMTSFYELIDLRRKKVWGTADFSAEDYADFNPPMFWFKNDPRVKGWADSGEFLRSPGCSADGLFSYLYRFDRKFLNVVQLIEMGREVDRGGLIKEFVLEKYHRLFYSKGKTVPILISPTGERFIGVSRSLDRDSESFDIPRDWILKRLVLKEDLVVDLVGTVLVLRTNNKDSFQGPLANELEL
ncbi:MAG: hypothetical protein AAF197_13305 [Pseudomonadota bacterium]